MELEGSTISEYLRPVKVIAGELSSYILCEDRNVYVRGVDIRVKISKVGEEGEGVNIKNAVKKEWTLFAEGVDEFKVGAGTAVIMGN